MILFLLLLVDKNRYFAYRGKFIFFDRSSVDFWIFFQCVCFVHVLFLLRCVCFHADSLLSAYWQSSTLCQLVGVQHLANVFVVLKLTRLL